MSFQSFTDNPFFRSIDFEALEKKEVEPVFVPNAEKTNFDATYDLEELLLEEAPLEARARRQKPREELKDNATDKEIREEELYKMIESQFLPFDYTTAAYEKSVPIPPIPLLQLTINRYAGALDTNASPGDTPHTQSPPLPQSKSEGSPLGSTTSQGSTPRSIDDRPSSRKGKLTKTLSKSQPSSPSDSPPGQSHLQPNGQQRQTVMASQPTSHPRPNNHRHASSRSEVGVAAPLSPYQASYNRQHRPSGTRKESQGGGVQVVLGEGGSWSELAKKDATLPADANLIEAAQKPTGMLGFLNRKRGRGHSPKPQERGILGKEGARVVISNGAS